MDFNWRGTDLLILWNCFKNLRMEKQNFFHKLKKSCIMSHASKIMNQDTKPVPHFVELNFKLMLRDKKAVPIVELHLKI